MARPKGAEKLIAKALKQVKKAKNAPKKHTKKKACCSACTAGRPCQKKCPSCGHKRK